jgi:hypothetical protein
MGKMEARLVKTGRRTSSTASFKSTLDRGVFIALSEEEASRYKGPVNYISMVEAFKMGPHRDYPLENLHE